MTHPPPDPEGRQNESDDLHRLAERLCDMAHTVAPREERLAGTRTALRQQRYTVRAETLMEARASFAARLDAALAGDPREAVERCWALVRELRGE